MIIYVLRHGIAIDRDAPDAPEESQRFLTDKGRRRTKAAVRGMTALDIAPEAILSSPWLRAEQTAEIARKRLAPSVEIELTDSLLPDAPTDRIIAELRARSVASAMVVGHAPHLDELVAHAVGARELFTKLDKAGLAILNMTGKGMARLHAVYPARALRAL
jgi:phosphohistidine phosphatase